MSHSCPECGQECYCHGDIDDCQVETEEYASMMCECPGSADCMVDRDDYDLPEDECGYGSGYDADDVGTCQFPHSCCMPGEHSPEECHTPEMLEAAYEEAQIPTQWRGRM